MPCRQFGIPCAEYNGITAGIIIWHIGEPENKDTTPGPLRYIPLKLTRQGRASLQFMIDYEEYFEDFIMNKTPRYQAEITLFIVDSKFRGQGIGRMLFDSAIESIRSEGCGNLFLRTDGDCNYQFYDRYGMTCRVQDRHLFKVGKVSEDLDMRIYDLTFDEITNS